MHFQDQDYILIVTAKCNEDKIYHYVDAWCIETFNWSVDPESDDFEDPTWAGDDTRTYRIKLTKPLDEPDCPYDIYGATTREGQRLISDLIAYLQQQGCTDIKGKLDYVTLQNVAEGRG